MKRTLKYIISALIITAGLLLALFSNILLPSVLNDFWRVLTELLGYGIIAVGCGMLGIIGKSKK